MENRGSFGRWTVFTSTLLLLAVFGFFFQQAQCQSQGFERRQEDFRFESNVTAILRERFGAAIEPVPEYTWTDPQANTSDVDNTQTSLLIVGHTHTATGGRVVVFRLHRSLINVTVAVNSTLNTTQTRVKEDWLRYAVFSGQDTVRGDGFGTSISASADGRVIAVAAPFSELVTEDPNYDMNNGRLAPNYQFGSVYIFTEGTPGRGNWAQTAIVDIRTAGLTGQYMDLFGSQIKLNEAGTELIVSSATTNNAKKGLFMFYYDTTSSTWKYNNVRLSDNLRVPPGLGTKGARFGTTSDFSYIVMRTNNGTITGTDTSDDQITVFERVAETPLSYQVVQTLSHQDFDNRSRWFGWDIEFDSSDNSFVVGTPLFDGDVTHYTFNGTSGMWEVAHSLYIPLAGKSYFGNSVAIRNTTRGRFAVVGAPIEEVTEKGAAYVFQYDTLTNQWNRLLYLESSVFQFNQLTSPLTTSNVGTNKKSACGDLFGGNVAITDSHIFISAEQEGSVYAFKIPDPPVPQPTEPEPQVPETVKSTPKEKRGLELVYILVIAVGGGFILLVAGIIAGIFAYRRIRKNKLLKLAAKYREMNPTPAPAADAPPQ